METKTYTTIDRSAWPAGPWDGEPDKVQWQDGATGLPCLAVRHHHSGHWCGYVGVPPNHPLHGKGYSDVDVRVHGGLTFSNPCKPDANEASDICHVAGPGEPDHVWWFGFDCAHAQDYSPMDLINAARCGYSRPLGYQHYRALPYVREECAALAAQLAGGIEAP